VVIGGASPALRAVAIREDEPSWHGLIDDSSPESLRERFQSTIGRTTHQFATRYCHIDYDREMAIVAIARIDGREKMRGVGRLVIGPSSDDAEYAILVADPWQGKGLGTAITDYCMQIAGKWGVKRIYAATTSRNRRMLAVFKDHGFELTEDFAEGYVEAQRVMG